MQRKALIFPALAVMSLALTACGDRSAQVDEDAPAGSDVLPPERSARLSEPGAGGSIFDLFRTTNTESTVQVNRYIWAASIEVLDFLPVQSVDPFTGVIVTGFGNPPGGGRAYRATVLINDPALDARSLNLALQTRAGPANAATVRAVEDAILTRARQLRVADSRL